MRCPECGYELGELLGGLACPECGTCSTPDQRLPLPPETKKRIFWGYAAVPLGAAAMGLIAGLMLAFSNLSNEAGPVVLYFSALIGGAIGGAIMGFLTTRRLMRRLPRRVASAPLLLLIPRNVLVPLMAACAAGAIAATLATGACVAAGISGIGNVH